MKRPCEPSPESSSGFTLIELLVVLAVLGLAMTILTPLPKSSRSSLEASVLADDIATALRRTQATAMRVNADQVFTLDLEQRTYVTGETPPTVIPEAFGVSLYTARDETVDSRTGQIRFFADGSATGGRIRLIGKDRQHDIHINWLTGRVWVHRP